MYKASHYIRNNSKILEIGYCIMLRTLATLEPISFFGVLNSIPGV